MANKQRNEVDVVLGEYTFTLRATFQCIAEIEDYFDESLAKIVMARFREGYGRVKDLKAIIAAGIKGAGDKPDNDKIEAAIMAVGVIPATTAVVDFLSQAFFGSPPEEEKN